MIKLRRNIVAMIQLLVGVRKLLVALLFMGVGLILLALNYVTGSEFISTSRDVVVAFMAINMGEHIAQTIAGWGKKK